MGASRPLTIEFDVEQGSEEWHRCRAGMVTASRFADALAVRRDGRPSQTRIKYLREVVAERMTGEPKPDSLGSIRAIRWGREHEEQARAAYALRTGLAFEEAGIRETGMVALDHDIGCSPDGLIGFDGGIEAKCPDPHTHIGYVLDGVVPACYSDQVQGFLWVTGRDWCDFLSFDPRMPPESRLFVVRAQRDEKRIDYIRSGVLKFVEDVQAEIAKLGGGDRYESVIEYREQFHRATEAA